MAFSLSPSVDVREYDLSLTIPNLPSSKTGIVLPADKGPCNYIQQVTNESDLVNIFGKPLTWTASTVTSTAGTDSAVKAWFNAWNFLQYADSLYVVRPLPLNGEVKGLTFSGITSATSAATTGLLNPDYAEKFYASSDSNLISRRLAIYENYVTNTENIAVSICSNASYWPSAITSDTTSMSTSALFSTNIWDSTTQKPVTFKQLFEFQPDWTLGEFAIVVLVKNSEGLWDYAEKYVVNYNSTGRDAYNRNNFAEEIIKASQYINCRVSSTLAGSAVDTCSFSVTALTITHSSYYPTIGRAQIVAAEAYFNDSETFDVNLLISSDPDKSKDGMATIAMTRRDCFAVVGPWDETDYLGMTNSEATSVMITKFGNSSLAISEGSMDFTAFSSYAGLFGNMKYQYDKFSDVNRWLPITGDVAGLMAQTDRDRDPWWAPAGLERGKIKNAIKLAFQPNKGNRDNLYVNSINPIMAIPGEGAAILFGQKTALKKPSAFDRINVRRLLLVLEKAIATASRYALFEFNDDFTRARIKSMIDPYLGYVKSRRGLYDYLVVCDSSNNTPEIIDMNALVIDIYLKPVRVAEFIQINMYVTKTGADFNEIIGVR